MNIKIGILNVPKHCNKHDLIHFVTSWYSNLFETDEAELDILSFQKTYKWAMETRRPKSNLSELLFHFLVTSNFHDDSIKNEWVSIETPFSH